MAEGGATVSAAQGTMNWTCLVLAQ